MFTINIRIKKISDLIDFDYSIVFGAWHGGLNISEIADHTPTPRTRNMSKVKADSLKQQMITSGFSLICQEHEFETILDTGLTKPSY